MKTNGDHTPNFDAIMAALPSMIQGYGKRKDIPAAMPTLMGAGIGGKQCKQCIIDHKFFGRVFTGQPIDKVKKDVCANCRKQLKAGWTAFITEAGRALMLRPRSGINPELIGKIVRVSDQQMDELWKLATGSRSRR